MTAARILFVDDEPYVLAGLRRMLHAAQQDWQVCVAENGGEALELLASAPFDVVVTDMRMPGMGGASFLEHVRRSHPATARLVLSGQADPGSVVGAAGPAQQYLAKPCPPEVLVATVQRVLAARGVVPDETWRARIGALSSLPKAPATYDRLVAATARPQPSLRAVVDVVSADVALTTEMLKLVNSAFFALTTRVDTVEQAAGLLGLDLIQALAISGTVFRPAADLPGRLDAVQLGARSARTGLLLRRIAAAEGWDDALTRDLVLAGLLHDVGLLVLAGAEPTGYERYEAELAVLPDREAQVEAFGLTVAHASALLLGLWGFPSTVVELIAQQPALPAGPEPAGPASPAGPVEPAGGGAGWALAFARLLAGGLDPADVAFPDRRRAERWALACAS